MRTLLHNYFAEKFSEICNTKGYNMAQILNVNYMFKICCLENYCKLHYWEFKCGKFIWQWKLIWSEAKVKILEVEYWYWI